MKKKIVGILVCTLLMATAVLPVVGTTYVGKTKVVKNDLQRENSIGDTETLADTIPIPVMCWVREFYQGFIPWASNNIHTLRLTDRVGIGTTNPDAKLDVANGSVLFQGPTGNTPISGSGTRFMWIPEKAALRAGEVSQNQWDDRNIGNFSVALGANTIASNWWTFAMGCQSNASGNCSTAIGYRAWAEGNFSIAMGTEVKTTKYRATHSIALGYQMWVSGNYSMGIGCSMHFYEITEDNVTAIMCQKVGINTTSPQASLHVNDTLLLTPRDSEPVNPTEGMIYFDNNTKKLMIYIDTSFQPV